MSVDLFKAEAKRLADHLAETHGVKLKHTSVLAAIAALHGARDWNTLIGQQKPGLLRRAAAALAGTSTPEHSTMVELEDLLYQLPPKGLRFGLAHSLTGATKEAAEVPVGQPVDVDDRNLMRHTLVVGPTGYGWSVLLESLAVQQVMRGGGLLVVDPRSDLHMAKLVQKASRHAGRDDNFTVLLDDAAAPADLVLADYDLFAGTDTSAIARRLVAAMTPTQPDNLGVDWFRTRMHEVLDATLGAMQVAAIPLQLAQLARIVLQPDHLFELLAQVQHSPVVASRLEQVMRPFVKQSKNGREIDMTAYQSALGGMMGRIAQWANSPQAANQPGRSLNLSQLFKQGQVGYATGCDKGSRSGAVKAFLDELLRVFEARKSELSRQPKGTELPFLLVLPFLTSVLPMNDIRRLLTTAVEANVAVVGHVTSLSVLDEESTTLADDVLTNTRLKVFFKQQAPRAFDQAASVLQFAAGALSPADQGALRERLMRLGMGEALLADGSAVQDLRLQVVRQNK